MFKIISLLLLFYIVYRIFLVVKKFFAISSQMDKIEDEIKKKKTNYSNTDIEEADYEEIK
jgi:uncharacterized membrane protein